MTTLSPCTEAKTLTPTLSHGEREKFMPPSPLYLDHNSTTPIDARVVEAMERCWREGLANPASQHFAGRKARKAIEEAREGIAEILGAQVGGMTADRLIFTSGGTEANNLALFGLMEAAAPGSRVVISAIEHPSITAAAEVLQRRGVDVQKLPVDGSGVVEVQKLDELLDRPTALVSVMLANNETGVLQPIIEIAQACAARGVTTHTDAVQAVGKVPVHFRELGVSALTIAAHKFHGPLGIGALLLRHEVQLAPQLWGGFQQSGLRPGTENVPLAVGMHTALTLWREEAEIRQQRMTQLRDNLEAHLRAAVPELVIIGERSPRLPQTSCIAFPGINRQALVMALDLAGVACSTGSACASGSSEPSPVLLAMGLSSAVVEGSIRLSLGAFTTATEIAQASERILRCANNLRHANSARKSPVAARQEPRNPL
jgi:cysteine desulfurase